MIADRVFLIVLDSLGIGELPDAADYGDEGSDTLAAVAAHPLFAAPFLSKLGLFDIDGVTCGAAAGRPAAVYGRLKELSAGKDTTTGHWEMAGIVRRLPFPTFPRGFDESIISAFSSAIGRGVLCNRPYSGTEVIKDYGREHLATGKPIVYTSADSVFQIAAHKSVTDVETLYGYCRAARALLIGQNAVARVIARPFEGDYPFIRSAERKDFALPPPPNLLNKLSGEGLDVIAVGKIDDIFCSSGITRSVPTHGNAEGHAAALTLLKRPFKGLCFVNLVDFDMLYGHRNDIGGYAAALKETDAFLSELCAGLGPKDAVIITADHGCDPSTPSTDHSREYVPFLLYYRGIRPENIGTREGLGYVGETVCALLGKG